MENAACVGLDLCVRRTQWCVCDVFPLRSAGGLHPVFLCDADQEDLAVLCSPAPPSGQALPGPLGNHSLHQQVLHDLHGP